MAYNFLAEKRSVLEEELPLLYERLAQCTLIETFPVDIVGDLLAIGISIPIKAMDESNFGTELVDLMDYLVKERSFKVTDIFTGNSLSVDDIQVLPQSISS